MRREGVFISSTTSAACIGRRGPRTLMAAHAVRTRCRGDDDGHRAEPARSAAAIALCALFHFFISCPAFCGAKRSGARLLRQCATRRW